MSVARPPEKEESRGEEKKTTQGDGRAAKAAMAAKGKSGAYFSRQGAALDRIKQDEGKKIFSFCGLFSRQ